MGLILSIDTSTQTCGIALYKGSQLLGQKISEREKSHAQLITVLIDDLLKEFDYSYEDLEAIAVGEGPGSYTGLRIGLSTAKGLCFALEKPLITVKTLEAMAFAVAREKTGFSHFLPMIDARRNEVYTLLGDAQGGVILESHARILDEEPLLELSASDKVLCFGDGAEKATTLLDCQAEVSYEPQVSVSGAMIGELAFQRYQNQEFADLAYVEPFYLKPVRITASKKHERILQNGGAKRNSK